MGNAATRNGDITDSCTAITNANILHKNLKH